MGERSDCRALTADRRGAVFADQDIATATETIRQCDDRLTALSVLSVRGDTVRIAHADLPFLTRRAEIFRALNGFQAAPAAVDGLRLLAVGF
jgi:hypothetical protein